MLTVCWAIAPALRASMTNPKSGKSLSIDLSPFKRSACLNTFWRREIAGLNYARVGSGFAAAHPFISRLSNAVRDYALSVSRLVDSPLIAGLDLRLNFTQTALQEATLTIICDQIECSLVALGCCV